MLTKRIIACLDVRDGSVVKGLRFEDLALAGDPAALARRYNDEGIDEMMLLDITATLERRRALLDTVSRVAATLFIPLGVGGGVRSLADAEALFDAGADKVSLNSAALANPPLISEIAGRYGSQAVVIAVDAKNDTRRRFSEGNDIGCRFPVFGRSGTIFAQRDAVSWAREAADRGAGEILLTSIDRDGTREGFDCELTAAVSAAVSIPVIASGGAGGAGDFADVFERGRADAALAASIFHFGEVSVAQLKRHLASRGLPMREVTPC
ncbi:MAG: imidazole glycerol phosphate synthase subunit HisF [Acidobacteria bacterium]|nr:MAG: imidazole glycerol phosphate synthase subunit HisF [Acidobacteriota bacterium]